ncbi:hypothetical protein AVEN_184446-1 [Araneus ventricosus]|uniref:Uncharacterized protein n=1 Tax=Araneus ventricosus TaxID=182803 RepID=A0A4Y2BFS4_ARAVE|nr:hypothetical protein AVEN_184446-1 [Araneus ventricosus]
MFLSLLLLGYPWIIAKQTAQGDVCSPPDNLNSLPLANFEKSGNGSSWKVPSQDYMEGEVRHPNRASTTSKDVCYPGERPLLYDWTILSTFGQWLASNYPSSYRF